MMPIGELLLMAIATVIGLVAIGCWVELARRALGQRSIGARQRDRGGRQ